MEAVVLQAPTGRSLGYNHCEVLESEASPGCECGGHVAVAGLDRCKSVVKGRAAVSEGRRQPPQAACSSSNDQLVTPATHWVEQRAFVCFWPALAGSKPPHPHPLRGPKQTSEWALAEAGCRPSADVATFAAATWDAHPISRFAYFKLMGARTPAEIFTC